MSNFKVGDWVKVLDKGQSFSGYTAFFPENNLNEFASKYARKSTVNGEHYQIVGIGKHSDQHDYYGPLYVLQAQGGKIYLMHNGCPHDPEKGFELTEPPVAKPKFQIGDKVVPVSKSVWRGDCPSWRDGKCKYPFLFVNGIDAGGTKKFGKTVYECGCERNFSGDYYLESDLRPYVEPTPKPKFKPGDRIRIKPMSEIQMIVDAGPVFAGWSPGMTEYTEKVYTVQSFINGMDGVFGYRLRKISYSWDERFLDLVVDEPEVKKEYPKEIDGEWVGGKSVFKVGDRVRVKTMEQIKKEFPLTPFGSYQCGRDSFNDSMACLCGKTFVIQDITRGYVKGLTTSRNITPEMLELLPPINHCPQNKTVNATCTTVPDLHLVEVQTIFNGPATVCVLKYDGKEFKGTAKCNPADQWNEATGQIIAMERASIKLSEYRIAQAMK